MLNLIAVLPLLATLAAATPVERWYAADSVAMCKTFHADITASAMNVDLASVIGGLPASEQAWVQAQVDSVTVSSNISNMVAAAPLVPVSGTYSMYFQYCCPKTGTPKGVFQAHHGLVGNAAYWNVQLDGRTDNSFAESAAAAGWSTLAYDRLGVGKSAHPQGIDVVQINYEIAQSIAVAGMLRSGAFDGIDPINQVVGVGHSYGSVMMAGVASVSPDAFDQVVLTGFSANVTSGVLGVGGFESTIANVAYPDRFPYGSDYISTPSVSIDQKEFFHYPNYTQSALDLFTSTKGEYTIGQLTSIAGPFAFDRSNFTKPTFIITGNKDAPFCTSDCTVTSLGAGMTQIDTARPLFPSVADADFATYNVPDTAHGINFHTTAYDAYQQIINFVASHAM